MIEPLYCTQCGTEIGEGCECAVFWNGPHCELTGRENCDCEYCAPSAEEDEEE